MSANHKRTDVVATITITTASSETTLRVLREDVTGTNGAYRAIQDTAHDEVTWQLQSLQERHRAGEILTAM